MISNPAVFALSQFELQVIVALLEQYPEANIFDPDWRAARKQLVEQFAAAIGDRNKPFMSKVVPL